MDRISVRSFRAPDLAEHGLRELARSRLDTTREVSFQPLGTRFVEAREDVARMAALLHEDAFRAPAGHFSRLVLRVEPSLAERSSSLDPRAIEARLEEATRKAVERALPRAEGVYLVRFEPGARGGLEPVAHVHLSCRLSDGGPAPILTREDARRFQERWSREVERALDGSRVPARALDREHTDRASALSPEAERLRQEWARAYARFFAVYTERIAGGATQKELVEAAEHARAAREAWGRQLGPPVDLRDVERRQILDVIRLRIEGGSRYLAGPLEAQRRAILETAASRAAGLPEGPERHLAVVAWLAGPDLQATLYFNQRSRPQRSPESIEPERLRETLERRLGDEIRRFAPTLDSTAAARSEELGRIEARLPQREAKGERAVPLLEREADLAAPDARSALVVTLDRDASHPPEAALARGRADQPDSLDPARPRGFDWTNERVFSVRLRVPTGAEQLERTGLSPEETAHLIQRAVDRAYPFLAREGIRGNFLIPHGKALDVRVLLPESLGWTHHQLRGPLFQQRFIAGFHQALAQVGPTRLAPAKEPVLPGIARSLATLRGGPQLLRQAEQDPERAARDVTRAVFNRLSEALPKPFRAMRELGRSMGRLVNGRE